VFPFSAIVGQERLKLALLLNAVDPRVGGVLIRGEKGTAKSTAVRALSAVMPKIAVVDGCRFSCDPADPASWCDECRTRRDAGPLPRADRPTSLVELPVSATEDRLVGTLDLEHALRQGEKRFEPGLLARANRAILYVDEVNLLDDHIVDTLLDAAAMGVNTVEREGVSFRHPARFVLVGTMNPEEGELRPQLLDRFGLCVDVQGERDPEARVEIVRRRREFDRDPRAFAERWADHESELRARLRAARARIDAVQLPDELLYSIANLALTVGVDGHRADEAMARAAAAHAALQGRDIAELADIAAVAGLVLAHRTKRTLFDEPKLDASALSAVITSVLGEADQEGEASESGTPSLGADDEASSIQFLGQKAVAETPAQIASTQLTLAAPRDRRTRSTEGKTQQSLSDSRGRAVSSRPAGDTVAAGDVAVSATLRAAAARPQTASTHDDLALTVESEDLQRKVRSRKVGATVVFCVDASGSMGAAARLDAARTAVLDLLVDAYQRRDRVGVVTFRGQDASVVLSPTASVQLAQMRLAGLPTGGATPLAAGILASLDILAAEKRRDPSAILWLVLVTDGRANVGLEGGVGSEDALSAARQVKLAGVNALLVDVSGSRGTSPHARELAEAAGGQLVRAGDGGHTLGEQLRERIAHK
jgi:magnesium chelatase subunit D